MKRLLSIMIVMVLSLAVLTPAGETQAKKTVSAKALSTNWTVGSKAAKKLRAYVKKVTNSKDKKNFIPKKDRIVTFDMDGTLTCETYFTYFDTMMFIDYCLKDHPDKVSEELRVEAASITPGYTAGEALARNFAKAYAGMTVQELYDYAVEFGKRKTNSFTNMRYVDGFYLPMVELVKYLYKNGFTIYVVSGTERTTTRALVANSPIAKYVTPNHVIGTEFEVKVKGHEETASNMDYKYADGDELVFTGGFLQKNLNANKSIWIEREIGQRPVLAFGNSGSDTSMMNYAIDKRNPYPSQAYMVVADDATREWGTQDWEKKSADYSAQGYVPISMKNDFKKIYNKKIKPNKDRGLSLPEGITPVTWHPSAEELMIKNDEAKALYTRLKAGDYPTVEELKASPVVGWLDALSNYYKALYGITKDINTPGREKLREELLNKFLARGSAKQVTDSKTGKKYYENTGALKKDFKMELVLGLPASGKSSTVVNPDSEKMGAFIMDPDDLKATIPEYVASHGAGADAIHMEGVGVNKKAIEAFTKGDMKGNNVIIPLVSTSLESLMESYIKPFEEAGYEVTAKYVDVPVQVSMARNIARELEGGQLINSAVVFSFGETVRKTYDDLIKLTNSKGNSYDGGLFTNDYKAGSVKIAA